MPNPFNLSKEEMRKLGYNVIDKLVDHLDELRSKSPITSDSRRNMDERLTEELPAKGMKPEKVFDHIIKNILTYSNYLNHPKYFGYVPSPSNYVSAMADTLATGFNTFTGGWSISSGPAETEIITINWLLELFGLPVKWGGGTYTSGGSMANLTALVTARYIKCGDDFTKAVLYTSDQTHSSVRRGARVVGFQEDQLRLIPTNEFFQIRLDLLEESIIKDKKEGKQPICIIGNAGTTNTGSVDDLTQIANLCEKHALWMHVDAAYGGGAILSEKGKNLFKGIEKADSITVDPHKWFFQPYEMGCILVRKHTWLTRTFREEPEYLKGMRGVADEINFHELGLQLTRRFRALKLYASFKTFGVNAFQKAISYNIDLIEELQLHLEKNTNWEIISPATLAVINFRYRPKGLLEKELDELNESISDILLKEREAVILTTKLNEKLVLRICSTNPSTTLQDLIESVDRCAEIGQSLINK